MWSASLSRQHRHRQHVFGSVESTVPGLGLAAWGLLPVRLRASWSMKAAGAGSSPFSKTCFAKRTREGHMGKLAHVIKFRFCLICRQTVNTTSAGMRAHMKACTAAKRSTSAKTEGPREHQAA